MKKSVLLVLCSLLVVQLHAQNILVANNNPGAAAGTGPGANIYTGTNALEDAIAAAVSGDIIYLVPSSTGYGNNDIVINIPLTIFGVGIRPSKDLGTRSVIDVNCFLCELAINSSNVRISGIIVDGDIALNKADTQDLTDINIENCRVERILMNGSAVQQISNLLIRNNVITGNGSVATHVLLRTTSNALVTNNIMVEGGISAHPMVVALGASFFYNVFSDNGGEGPFSGVINCFFDHNIFYGVGVDIGVGATGNTWNYNLAFGSPSDASHIFNVSTNGNTGVGNIESVAGSDDPMFTNFPLTQNWDDSYDLTLLVGSSALNVNGEDIGPSGGATPFDSEGNLLPLIQSVTIPAVIPVGSDLPVNIKAKGN